MAVSPKGNEIDTKLKESVLGAHCCFTRGSGAHGHASSARWPVGCMARSLTSRLHGSATLLLRHCIALWRVTQAMAFLYDKDLVGNLFENAPERYAERPGGYTRVKTEPVLRRGDATEMAVIELV